MIVYLWPWHYVYWERKYIDNWNTPLFDILKYKILESQKNYFLSTLKIPQVAKSIPDFVWLAVVQR